MIFHFVDQILEFEPAKRAVGLKHVTVNDSFLMPTKNGTPALLSCIVGEALGQLCSWNVIKTTDCQVRSVAGIVSEVTLHRPAYLGETIVLEVLIDELNDEAVIWEGIARINGEIILKVHSSVGPCLAMKDFNDIAEVRNHLQTIDRPGPIPEIKEAKPFVFPNMNYNLQWVRFDNILAWEKGKTVTAEKHVSIIAPYLQDHFPKKPVLPISLLLETKLQLGYEFLQDLLGESAAEDFIPSRVYDIKMNDFVQPGDSVVTHLRLKEKTDDRIVLSYRSEMNGKRICVAHAEFTRQSKCN